MGQLIISAAAATAGYMIGGPTGAQIGWALGSAISAPKIPGQHSAQPIMDLKVTGTEYGQPIPWVRGSSVIAGQVWWNTDRRPTTTTTVVESDSGKGGGAEDSTSSTTTYDMDMLIGLTDNEIIGIARIWNNGALIYTADSGATAGSLAASAAANAWTRLTVYTGSMTQLPDPTYEAAVGTANAPAYRGRAYVFIESLKLGGSGQVPNLTFEVVADGAYEITLCDNGDITIPDLPGEITINVCAEAVIGTLTLGNGGSTGYIINNLGSIDAVSDPFSVGYVVTGNPIGGGGWTLTAVEIIPTLVGFHPGGPGSISPPALLGNSILQLVCDPYAWPAATYFGVSGDFAQTALFTTMTFNGVPLTSASADYFSTGSGSTTWGWSGIYPITVAGDYSVTFT